MGRRPAVRQARCQVQRHTPQFRRDAEQDLHQPQRVFKSNSRSKQCPILKPVPNGWLVLMLRLLQRYTPLVWLAALSILVGSATAAITTILDPDASMPYGISGSVEFTASTHDPIQPDPLTSEELASSVPTSTADVTPSQQVQQSESPSFVQSPSTQRFRQPSSPASPRSAVGAIALSCAAGCFLLSQWLKPKPTSRRRVLFETSQPSPHQKRLSVKLQPQVDAQPVSTLPILASEEARLPQLPVPLSVPRLPAASPISFDLNPAQMPSAETAEPVPTVQTPTVEVTVLPDGQSYPLDWNEPSLADSLDLRQRRPLSYWL
jgi:hypothetical protein